MSSCPLCGEARAETLHIGRDLLYRTTAETFPIVRCAACGLARLAPWPANVSRYYPEGYWHRPTPLQEVYRRLAIRDHVRFARRALGNGNRALDVGCGSGLFLNRLRAAVPGLAVTGLDSSAEAAAIARERYSVEVITGELTNADFATGSFDLITMFHVLEHLPDPLAYIRAAKGLLMRGGRLVVQTPNLDCLQYRVFGEKWIGLDVPRHLIDFRTADLRRLLERGGFAVRRVKHFSWRDNAACLATTIAPGLEPVARASRGLPPRNPLYLGLTMLSLPFAMLESAFGRGATVMLEAEVR